MDKEIEELLEKERQEFAAMTPEELEFKSYVENQWPGVKVISPRQFPFDDARTPTQILFRKQVVLKLQGCLHLRK